MLVGSLSSCRFGTQLAKRDSGQCIDMYFLCRLFFLFLIGYIVDTVVHIFIFAYFGTDIQYFAMLFHGHEMGDKS